MTDIWRMRSFEIVRAASMPPWSLSQETMTRLVFGSFLIGSQSVSRARLTPPAHATWTVPRSASPQGCSASLVPPSSTSFWMSRAAFAPSWIMILLASLIRFRPYSGSGPSGSMRRHWPSFQ